MHMKTSLFLLTLFFTLPSEAQKGAVNIGFHKNIELVGYLIHLVDPSDNDPDHPISRELNKWPDDKNLPILAGILEIAGDMEYNFLIDLFYALPEFPLIDGYELPVELLSKYGYDSDSEVSRVRNLVDRANEFSKSSHFEKVWMRLEPFRQQTLTLLKGYKPTRHLIDEMERFYGQVFSIYEIVPSLTLWSGPGWGNKDDENHRALFILGPLGKNYEYSDGEKFENLAIHEFGHAFANDVVLENRDLIQKTEALFAPVKEWMIPQGYSDWKTCLTEHFVRAGEVILLERSGDSSASTRLREHYSGQLHFSYLPFIVDKLNYYRTELHYSYRESVFRTLIDLEKEP